MDLFGFAEDVTDFDNVEVISKVDCVSEKQDLGSPVKESRKQMGIEEIHELLMKDVNSSSPATRLSPSMNETLFCKQEEEQSLIIDTKTPLRTYTRRSVGNGSILKDKQNSYLSLNTPLAKRSILEDEQNSYLSPTTPAKRKYNDDKKRARKKVKKENIENEDHLAEELNNSFKEVEQFQLLVE